MKGRIIFDVEGTAVSADRRAELKLAMRKVYRDYVNDDYNIRDWNWMLGQFHSYTCYEIPDVDELMKALYGHPSQPQPEGYSPHQPWPP